MIRISDKDFSKGFSMSTLIQARTFNNHPKYQVEEVSQAEFLAAIKKLRQKDTENTYSKNLEAKFLANLG